MLIDVCMPDLDGFRARGDDPRASALSEDRDHLRLGDPGDRSRPAARLCRPARSITCRCRSCPDLLRAKVRVFAELYRKTRQLETLNAELERRVAERTAELAQANAELEQRVEERTREREAALAQVHEMRKVESLGQLTGGVAHDFNNLLMAVLGNLELLAQDACRTIRKLRA